MGGARPKANVVDEEDDPWIAKFPSTRDRGSATERAEVSVSELARLCGIGVPESRRELSKTNNPVCLFLRFDRLKKDGKTRRVPYISARTALGRQGREMGSHA